MIDPTFDLSTATQETVAEDVAAKPHQADQEEVRTLARSYLALLQAVRSYSPCPVDVACGCVGCKEMRKILNAAERS
jgi:hypothetical protein